MTDKAPRSSAAADAKEAPVVPVRLVRGNASPEELSAVIAIVAVLASVDEDDGPGRTGRPPPAQGSYPPPPWSSPTRKVRTRLPHGPGGWRASAFPG